MSRAATAAGWLSSAALVAAVSAFAAGTIPADLEQPGSQPAEATLAPVGNCNTCHAGIDPLTEPSATWAGAMKAHSARDPLLWAALAVAEQDFVPNPTAWANLYPTSPPDQGGAGELCLRCHAPAAWLAGRSTPTSGGALAGNDFDGVSCDTCHRAIDPVSPEAMGLVRPDRRPYWINPRTSLLEGFHGSGQFVIEARNAKRGPYDNAEAPHGFEPLAFDREGELCGTCHDVSNPAVGGLAPNSGRLDATALGRDAALSNPPYAYGVLERTYSEWRASAWPGRPTAAFATLPFDLRRIGGAPEIGARAAPYNSSTDPLWNPPRAYTCQTCHLRPVTGIGCNLVAPRRSDLPLHDLTGGNTWVPEVMIWLSGQGQLHGGPLAPGQVAALRAGVTRARATLRQAAWVGATRSSDRASLVVRVVNLTGHKLPSGYPEGRRAWLNVAFYDGGGNPLGEAGRYDPATAVLTRDTRIYEATTGMTQDWAQVLVGYGWDPAMVLTFRPGGAPEWTLGDLAAGTPGAALATFHFVLNNSVLDDRRIPPYGLDPAAAAERQCSPVPAAFFPVLPDGTLAFADVASFLLPPGAARAEVTLFYQTASREYIAFLSRADTTTSDGADLYQAWAATGMSPPEPIATATWTDDGCAAPPPPASVLRAVKSGFVEVALDWTAPPEASFFRLYRHRARDVSDPPAWLEARSAAASDAVLDDGGSYYYDVRSENECGESGR